MTVESFAKKLGFDVLCMPCPEKEISGVYIGDLLSWVMGKANSGNVWITIMSNINIAAVATLTDLACILLAENVRPDDEVIDTANTKGVNILASSVSAYDIATKIAGYIS